MDLIHRKSKPFSIENPYRSKRPTTSKIIFLSCEGSESSTGRKAGSKYPLHGYGSQSEAVWHRSGVYL